jgi:hypothetical protein
MANDYKEDPLVTQAAIAYVNWRAEGGQGDWEPFRRQWLIDHGKAQLMANKKEAKDGPHPQH